MRPFSPSRPASSEALTPLPGAGLPGDCDQQLLSFLAAPTPGKLGELASQLTADQWDEVVTRTHRHQLAPLFFKRINDLHAGETLPPPVQVRLRTIYKAAVARSLLHEQELRYVLDALTAVDVRPVVYKGAALARTLYPAPACRLMGDIDLWVSAAEIGRAQAALENAGYRQRLKETRPLALQQQHDGELQLQGGQSGQGFVELHWGAFRGHFLTKTSRIDRAAVRERCVPLSISNHSVWTLDPEDTLIQLTIHIGINHQMTFNVARSLMDIALLAQCPLDWQVVIARSRAWQVSTAVGYVLSRVQSWVEVPALQQAVAALAPTGMKRRLLTALDRPPGLQDAPTLAASRLRFLFLFGLVDRPQAALALFYRTLWPERRWLEARYGKAGLGVRVRHLFAAAEGDI